MDVTEARGQCALRGGILDVYPVGQPNALRLEFFDDEVDSPSGLRRDEPSAPTPGARRPRSTRRGKFC